MTLIRATRVPDGGTTRGGVGPPPTARYATAAAWPGITWGYNAQCQCTWAPCGGAYQVKYLSICCPVHAGRPPRYASAVEIGTLRGLSVTWQTPPPVVTGG